MRINKIGVLKLADYFLDMLVSNNFRATLIYFYLCKIN